MEKSLIPRCGHGFKFAIFHKQTIVHDFIFFHQLNATDNAWLFLHIKAIYPLLQIITGKREFVSKRKRSLFTSIYEHKITKYTITELFSDACAKSLGNNRVLFYDREQLVFNRKRDRIQSFYKM